MFVINFNKNTWYNVYRIGDYVKIVFKRLVAHMIDGFLITMIATLITSNSYINKDYKEYNKTYNEYESFVEKYEESKESLDDALEYESITDDEYDKKIEKLNKDYNEKTINYNYKIIKLSIVPTIINILLILLYFTVIQYYFNGKTLGKWIMKLKVVSNNNKNLNILNYLIRSLILNNVLINILNVIMILVLSKSNYIIYNNIIYIVSYAIEMSIIFMILFNKENKGLHDYIANTKVIYEGVEENEV